MSASKARQPKLPLGGKKRPSAYRKRKGATPVTVRAYTRNSPGKKR